MILIILPYDLIQTHKKKNTKINDAKKLMYSTTKIYIHTTKGRNVSFFIHLIDDHTNKGMNVYKETNM